MPLVHPPRRTRAGYRWGNKWHPEQGAPADHIRTLYRSGLSTRQIAEQVGYSKSRVSTICHTIARTREEAAVLRQPPRSTHWRSARAAARKAVERHTGRKLSPLVDVHHKDGDYTNNAIENLEPLPHAEHARLHWRQRRC